jgi:hypothetical protein
MLITKAPWLKIRCQRTYPFGLSGSQTPGSHMTVTQHSATADAIAVGTQLNSALHCLFGIVHCRPM